IWRKRNQFHCAFAHAFGIKIASAPAVFDADVLADGPTQFLQALQKRRVTALRICVVRGQVHKYTNLPHSAGWLCPSRERPRCRRAAEQRDELAARHSITSSARASSVGGTSMPSAFAVLRLMTSSNLVGACTGRSAGGVPLRIRSMYSAARG